MSRSDKVVDPVLAFGRQSTLHFFQLTENLSGKIIFIPLQNVQLPYDLLNFGWLNTRCLGILDTTETFHLYDVRNYENLEDVDLSDSVELCYGSSFFKGSIQSLHTSCTLVKRDYWTNDKHHGCFSPSEPLHLRYVIIELI